MAKTKEVYVCQNCGTASPKWQGQCAACGEWNTLAAEILSERPGKSAQAKRAQNGPVVARGTGGGRGSRASRPVQANSTVCWAAASCRGP